MKNKKQRMQEGEMIGKNKLNYLNRYEIFYLSKSNNWSSI